MSILNVVVNIDEVVIAVDTDGVLVGTDLPPGMTGDHRHGPVSKLYPLVHLPAIIAYRGYHLVPSTTVATSSLARSYDALAQHFGEMADDVTGAVGGQHPFFKDICEADHHIVVAGWSDRLDSMDCTLWERVDGSAYRAVDFGECMMSPTPFDDPERSLPAPDSLSDHIAVARMQAKRLRDAPDDLAGGGDLVVATLTRWQVGVDIIPDFTRDETRIDSHGMVSSRASLR